MVAKNNQNFQIPAQHYNSVQQQNNSSALQSSPQGSPQQLTQLNPPGTSGSSDQPVKSFASEMTKNRQKFLIMHQQNQSNKSNNQSLIVEENSPTGQQELEAFSSKMQRQAAANKIAVIGGSTNNNHQQAIHKKLSLLKKNHPHNNIAHTTSGTSLEETPSSRNII